jgi:predicted metal-dependent hydrolase
MPLTIKQHERATRITLRIEPGGRALKMTIPSGLAQREVNAFPRSASGLAAHQARQVFDRCRLRDGGTILFRGVSHRIQHTGSLRGLTEAIIDGRPVLKVSGMPEHLGRRIATFLKKEARADLERLATSCQVYQGADQFDLDEGYAQPLGLVFVGRKSELFLAHRHGAAVSDRLSGRP